MPPVALPLDTQLLHMPQPPAMVRFWSPMGPTAAAVSTLPKLATTVEVELRVEHLHVPLPAQGAVRTAVRVGAPLTFRVGSNAFALDHDEE